MRTISAQKAGIRKGLASGIGEGIMRFMFYAMNSLAYWYGVSLVLADRDKTEKEYTPAVLMIVRIILSRSLIPFIGSKIISPSDILRFNRWS